MKEVHLRNKTLDPFNVFPYSRSSLRSCVQLVIANDIEIPVSDMRLSPEA
jgi:hypothetical protein